MDKLKIIIELTRLNKPIGFMLLFCPVEKQEEVRHALRVYKEMPFRFESGGSKVIFNIKQDTWKV